MASFFSAFQSIGPLFLVVFVGIIVSRKKTVDDKWIEVLNNYALWIGFPALILVALSRLEWDLHLYGNLIIWNSVRIVLSILIVLPVSIILKLNNTMRRTLFLAISFGNVAYLGIPVLVSSFGKEILTEATMISAVYLFWLFTLGIFLVEYFGDHQVHFRDLFVRLITNPLLLAVFVGLFIAVFHLKVPTIVLDGLDIFAYSVTGVVLFSLGLFMGKQSVGKLRDWLPVVAFCLVILFVLPSLFLLGTRQFIDVKISRSWILESAMPMGLTPYILCQKYQLNSEFASRVVVLSTFFALLSLPFWITVLS